MHAAWHHHHITPALPWTMKISKSPQNEYFICICLYSFYKHEGHAYLGNLIVLVQMLIFLFFTVSWTSPSEHTTSAKKIEDKVSKAVEIFVGRIRKMETDFIRYGMVNDWWFSLAYDYLSFPNITALMHLCLRILL